ncbi:MAG TPA: hypothetical protein H9986_06350 [Candidatus Prevotella stercoripullorum]|nr:hypothetical protein [Candidatus Prevotella stercoripullorum]
MNKQNILAWLQVAVIIMLVVMLAIAKAWFGEPQYVQAAALFTLMGAVGIALSLSCHDRLKSPRLVYFLITLAGGALFTALPFV